MTGNPNLDKILFSINGVVVLAATALVIYSHTIISPPPTDHEGEFADMIENSMSEYEKQPVVMKEIVVNLYSREQRLRFLNTIMNIDLFREEDRSDVITLRPFIFDIFIDIAGNMRPNELNSVTGRILLETRIKKRVNQFAKKRLIKRIFFSKYIIQ